MGRMRVRRDLVSVRRPLHIRGVGLPAVVVDVPLVLPVRAGRRPRARAPAAVGELLGAPVVCRRVTCSDASAWGYGAVEAASDVEDVKTAGRELEKSRFVKWGTEARSHAFQASACLESREDWENALWELEGDTGSATVSGPFREVVSCGCRVVREPIKVLVLERAVSTRRGQHQRRLCLVDNLCIALCLERS